MHIAPKSNIRVNDEDGQWDEIYSNTDTVDKFNSQWTSPVPNLQQGQVVVWAASGAQ